MKAKERKFTFYPHGRKVKASSVYLGWTALRMTNKAVSLNFSVDCRKLWRTTSSSECNICFVGRAVLNNQRGDEVME
jgi:hypothetical protein